MKKSIIALALISFLVILVTPQVNASDRDVGYEFILSIDNAAVVVNDQVVKNYSPEYVLSVELRDPGDMQVELIVSTFVKVLENHTGLRAKSPTITVPYTNGDLTFIASFQRYRCSTRIYNTNIREPNCRILSSSNGGIGY